MRVRDRKTDRETGPGVKVTRGQICGEYCTGLYLPGISRLQCGQSGWGGGGRGVKHPKMTARKGVSQLTI
jgi:hypothetical protein